MKISYIVSTFYTINMIQLDKFVNNDFKTIQESNDLRWVERDIDGMVIEIHKSNPKVGYSLALNPYDAHQYQTTPIIEIIEETDKVIQFKTRNNLFKLYLPKHFQEIYEKLKD